jgi:hypothetical protein
MSGTLIVPVGHGSSDTHDCRADGDATFGGGQTRPDTQLGTALANLAAPPSSIENPTPMEAANWAVLRFLGDTHDDLMKTRIAIGNRAARAAVDPDEINGVLELIQAAESAAELKLKREFRRSAPEIRRWVMDTPGLGEKLVARLLGVIGDPLWAEPMRWVDVAPEGHECDPDRCGKRHLIALAPFKRTPGQLLQFCGHGAPTRRTKGMTQDDALALGNPRAKMLTHLIAEGCMKCMGTERNRRSPYRDVYDEFREKYEPRDDWTPLHKHNAAIRATGKAVLIDLWRVADGQEPRRR